MRSKNGGVEELGVGGLPLGISGATEFESFETQLHTGATLLLYTDGLPEATGASGSAFGYERLQQLLRDEGRPAALLTLLQQHLNRHLGERQIEDDVSLVAIERLDLPPLPVS